MLVSRVKFNMSMCITTIQEIVSHDRGSVNEMKYDRSLAVTNSV